MPLDRDQPADDRKPRRTRRRRRRRSRLDAVVDDLEGRRIEPLAVREVPREPARDGDVHVGKARNRPVGEGEQTSLAERVEPVLRADQHGDAREPGCDETVEVGMDEVRMDDVGSLAPEDPGQAHERPRAADAPDAHAVDGDAVRDEPRGELLGTRLALVEHHAADVEAVLP